MKNLKILLGLILICFFNSFTFLGNIHAKSQNMNQFNTSILQNINITRIYNTTEQLSSYRTRLTGTFECTLAANDIYSILNNVYNVTDVFYENFSYNNTICSNVVARINGTTRKDELIIISAHYDSISMDQTAPGANDNAVAVALCMEIMGIIQNHFTLNRTLLFISFAGEEQAFIGSQAWINQHKNELANVVAVINLDMIGYGTYLSILKNDQSEWLADAIIGASSPIDLTFTKSNSPYPESARFDHETFWLARIPCVSLFEAGYIYPYYHTSEDTIDKVLFSLVEKCSQVTLLSVLYLGTVNFHHNWIECSIIIWIFWGLGAILPFIIYRKIK
ncbi:MAG: M28 family peptidase [Candidatus Helarchaeota archaeon]